MLSTRAPVSSAAPRVSCAVSSWQLQLCCHGPGRCTRQHYTFSAVPLTTNLALGTFTQVHYHEGDRKDAVGGGRVNKYCLLYHNALLTSHTAAITIPATHRSSVTVRCVTNN